MSKRTDLSLSEKVAILNKIRTQPQGTSMRKLGELFGMPKSTISKLIKKETVLSESTVVLSI